MTGLLRHTDTLVLTSVRFLAARARRVLAIYIIILPIAWLLIGVLKGKFGLAAEMVISLATGADLNWYAEYIRCCEISWFAGLLLHVLSWLVVPILVGLVVEAILPEVRRERDAQWEAAARVVADAVGLRGQQADGLIKAVRERLASSER